MKKIIALVLVCLMAMSAVAFADTLKMGTHADFPPYEYIENGEIVGIDPEIAKAVCDKLGYDLEIVDMAFDSIITAVTTGKVDFGMAGMTVTDERKQSVDFSMTYATGVQVIIVTEDSPITCKDDIDAGEGWTIAVQQGTTGDLYSTWDYEDNGKATVTRFVSGVDAVLALTSGKADFVVIDNEPAKNYVAANPGLKILDTEYITEDYAMAIAKDSELTAQIDGALSELIADGTVQAIIDKYIPAE